MSETLKHEAEKNLDYYADIADKRVAEFEQVLSRLVDRFDQIGKTISRLFAKGREQKENLMQMKDRAVESVRPAMESVAPAIHKTQDAGRYVAKKYRQDPRPFLIGGAVLLGGVALTVYLLRRGDEDAPFAERFGDAQPRTGNSSDYVTEGAPNPS
jgi:hypothetical protein